MFILKFNTLIIFLENNNNIIKKIRTLSLKVKTSNNIKEIYYMIPTRS